MPKKRSASARSGEASKTTQKPHVAPGTDDTTSSATPTADAPASPRNHPSSRTDSEQAEEEQQRQLNTGEENPA